MDALFKTSTTFASLSLKDVVEARDLFHYHLLNKKNVVATAVGLYRIRKSDPWPSPENPKTQTRRKKNATRRTLFNSEVRPYSWPCVYAFVSDWQYETDLASEEPSDVVPKSLFLPDGRAVPVCVIEARRQVWSKDLNVKSNALTPRNLLGPGSAIVNEDGQGMTRIATAGCIVRDGGRYYAMTNRHAIGAPGTSIKALQPHRAPEIGRTAKKGLTREEFHAVYPALHSTRQRLLMDIGLIELDNVLAWKTATPGIDPVGPVLDLYDNDLSLRLITMKVVGQSAISGLIRGEIQALFYRYKAMGGSEYIADFLIGPETYGLPHERMRALARIENDHPSENVALGVHHGDSGTMLFIEHKDEADDGKPEEIRYLPFGLLWGKEEFFQNGLRTSPYALATSLSTALDLLDLDFVNDLNQDQTYIWGWVGHYVIGRALALPTDLLTSTSLKGFIKTNLDALSLQPNDALDNNSRVQKDPDDEPAFVPLADVPDNVWKSNVNFTMIDGADGKKHHKVGPGNRGKRDNPNHFADLDLIYKDDKTFLELNVEDPDTYLNPEAWIDYFAAMQPQFDAWDKALGKAGGDKHWGALPFRVHQLFDIMVAAAKDRDAKLFLCAGGVLIHYIGDACQPLHASYLSQGDPERIVTGPRSGKPKMEAERVHGGYEDDMIAYGYQTQNLDRTLKDRIKELADDPMLEIASGYDASKAVIELISKTQEQISPRSIVDKWVELKGSGDRVGGMWQAFGDDTVTCMARGTRYLAKIWQAAWTAGDGDTNIAPSTKVRQKDLMALYNDPSVAPSIPLNSYPADKDADWSQIADNA